LARISGRLVILVLTVVVDLVLYCAAADGNSLPLRERNSGNDLEHSDALGGGSQSGIALGCGFMPGTIRKVQRFAAIAQTR
jgi:hypothetical protein